MSQPRIRAAVAIQTPEGLLLVRHQKRDRTYWLLPGGGVEYGESATAAARREVLEETGLEVDIDELMFVAETLAPDVSRHVVHLVFRGRLLGGTLCAEQETPVDGRGRVVEAQWVPLDKVVGLVMHPPFRTQLLKALQQPLLHPPIFLENLWIH